MYDRCVVIIAGLPGANFSYGRQQHYRALKAVHRGNTAFEVYRSSHRQNTLLHLYIQQNTLISTALFENCIGHE